MKIGILACLPILAFVSAAHAENMVSQATSYSEFTAQYCARAYDTDDTEHIMILPASVFAENKTVSCGGVTTGMRMAEDTDDPGHLRYNVDPLPGVPHSLDCDAKADVGIAIIALNCLPANHESKSHKKN
ncbi:hypothetical protein NBZ79_09490 [Sneathiella marina]|uniref:Uncharacterized protein n=1 Tax=Sneathiella marina TaxID=2950108 RepID=A0ABY4W7Q9_9PROT|nr:hypothetical protein [Sneathiella marina]USG63207.1 hypothetical protein NBZ79_09490 [Sneathiella marina]